MKLSEGTVELMTNSLHRHTYILLTDSTGILVSKQASFVWVFCYEVGEFVWA
jgi:hypothetical protein